MPLTYIFAQLYSDLVKMENFDKYMDRWLFFLIGVITGIILRNLFFN